MVSSAATNEMVATPPEYSSALMHAVAEKEEINSVGEVGPHGLLLGNFSFLSSRSWGNSKLLRSLSVDRSGGEKKPSYCCSSPSSFNQDTAPMVDKNSGDVKETRGFAGKLQDQYLSDRKHSLMEISRSPEIEEGSAGKPWNLRSRKRRLVLDGCDHAIAFSRRRFSAELDTEEIAEDLYAMTGKLPAGDPRNYLVPFNDC